MSTTPTPKPVSVLFVCLGNICRSTMAEGVFQSLTRPTTGSPHPLISRIDSCGTGAYHVGSPPNSQTMSVLKDNGITSYRHKARVFSTRDFDDFQYILAMDEDNLDDLMHLRKMEVRKRKGDDGMGKVMLFGEFGGKGKSGKGEIVDDPYYGGREGFEAAYEQTMRFSKAFVEKLEKGELS
ncbi:phosphotyrosine protein phosphatases I [Pleomassaria siparia CBS 279.74]|uniref:Phosphotyrosine protein phosphatases I n=1 Tax=Pleomassaria siparia CBS 279.74 TaxID=1314801 RepID=A0A6G1JWX7_9PLEO|nr:phosphotyrosine protein phosphatases I [Pleomassaria siparia CBS 279.74]